MMDCRVIFCRSALLYITLSVIDISFCDIWWTVNQFKCEDGQDLNLSLFDLPDTSGTRSYPLYATQQDRRDANKLLALFGGNLLQINKLTNSHHLYILNSNWSTSLQGAFDMVQVDNSHIAIAALSCLHIFSRNVSHFTEQYSIGDCDADPYGDPVFVDGDFTQVRFGGIINIEYSEDNIAIVADMGRIRTVDFDQKTVTTYKLMSNLIDMSFNGGYIYTLTGLTEQVVDILSNNDSVARFVCIAEAPCAEKGMFHKFAAVSPWVLFGISLGSGSLAIWDLRNGTKQALCEREQCSIEYPVDIGTVGQTIYIGSVWQAEKGGGLYDIRFQGDCDQLKLEKKYTQSPLTTTYLSDDRIDISCLYGSHNTSGTASSSIEVLCSDDGSWVGIDKVNNLECRENPESSIIVEPSTTDITKIDVTTTETTTAVITTTTDITTTYAATSTDVTTTTNVTTTDATASTDVTTTTDITTTDAATSTVITTTTDITTTDAATSTDVTTTDGATSTDVTTTTNVTTTDATASTDVTIADTTITTQSTTIHIITKDITLMDTTITDTTTTGVITTDVTKKDATAPDITTTDVPTVYINTIQQEQGNTDRVTTAGILVTNTFDVQQNSTHDDRHSSTHRSDNSIITPKSNGYITWIIVVIVLTIIIILLFMVIWLCRRRRRTLIRYEPNTKSLHPDDRHEMEMIS